MPTAATRENVSAEGARGHRWLRALECYGALVAALLTVSAILGTYWGKGVLLKQYDDAYITFRYAQNLSLGRGLVFNAGEPTDSASSISYTLLLALCHRIGFHNLPLVATILGVASAGGIAAVVHAGCMRRTWRPLLSLFLGVATGTHGLISGWAISGMETIPFAFLVALAVKRLFIVRAFGWLEVTLIGLVLWTRLEGILLGAAWGALWLRRLVQARADGPARKRLLLQAGCLGLVGVAFVLFKLWLYGAFLPHAFQLKQVTTLYAPNPPELIQFWTSSALALLVFAAVGITTVPRRYESWVLLGFVALSVYSVMRGPYADMARYSAHLMPVGMMLAGVPLSILWSSLPALGAIGCAYLGWNSLSSMHELFEWSAVAAGHQACRLQVGRYLEKHHPPGGAPVLSSDIGAIAYAAPNVRFIDAVGLTSSDILKAHVDSVSADPILFQKHPTVIADTCADSCKQPGNFSSENWFVRESYWLTPVGAHTYTQQLENGRVLFRCKSPDGLSFAATQFDFKR